MGTMQYVISMAVVDAVLQLTNNAIQLRLKWPNDIYFAQQKVGGVLCESVYDAKRKRYVITSGVGLNVSNAKPTLCVNDIIAQINAKSTKQSDEKESDELLALSREQVLSGFINNFEPLFEALTEK